MLNMYSSVEFLYPMLFSLDIFGHCFAIIYLVILSISLNPFLRIPGTFFNQQHIDIGLKSMYNYQKLQTGIICCGLPCDGTGLGQT